MRHDLARLAERSSRLLYSRCRRPHRRGGGRDESRDPDRWSTRSPQRADASSPSFRAAAGFPTWPRLGRPPRRANRYILRRPLRGLVARPRQRRAQPSPAGAGHTDEASTFRGESGSATTRAFSRQRPRRRIPRADVLFASPTRTRPRSRSGTLRKDIETVRPRSWRAAFAVGAKVEGRPEPAALRRRPPSTSCRRRRCAEGSLTTADSIRACPGRPRVTVEQQQGPSEVAARARPSATRRLERGRTRPRGGRYPRFAEQKIVRCKSFDGREITGLACAPPARFTGKRPVLVDIHGGPEGQAGSASSAATTTTSRNWASPSPAERARLAGYGKTFSRSTTA